MKNVLLGILLCAPITGWTQSISLDQCIKKAVEYSTISTQRAIHSDIAVTTKKSTSAAYIPQIDIQAQATYQSDVTSSPISIPGYDIPILSKDQYRATVDLQQLIYDGGYAARQKKVIESTLKTEEYQLDITQSTLKDRVSEVYLGILLSDANLNIIGITLKDLNQTISLLENQAKEGVTLKSNLDILIAERLKIEQRLIEAQSNRWQLVQLLSTLIGEEISTQIVFIRPAVSAQSYTRESKRPEYHLFEAQCHKIEAQAKVIKSQNMPKIYAFASTGYGRPAYNMFKNEFDKMYQIGARLSVPLTRWATTKHETRTLASRKRLVEQQQIEFTRTNRAEIINQIAEIEKFQKLINTDVAIVAKRNEVTFSQQQRLQNGVITSNDYLTDLNAESQSLLTQQLHEIQLLQAQITYNSLIGQN